MYFFKLTNDGLKHLLDTTFKTWIAAGDIQTGLIRPPLLPIGSYDTEAIEQREANYAGYARQQLHNPGWTSIAGSDAAEFLIDPVTFPPNNSPSAVQLTATFLYSVPANLVLAVLELPEQFQTVNPGQSLRLDSGFFVSRLCGDN